MVRLRGGFSQLRGAVILASRFCVIRQHWNAQTRLDTPKSIGMLPL